MSFCQKLKLSSLPNPPKDVNIASLPLSFFLSSFLSFFLSLSNTHTHVGTRSSTALKSTQTSTHTNSQLVQRMSLPRQSSSAYTYYLTYQCTTTILISLFREWESCQRELKRERERELHLYAFGPKLVSLYPGAIFRLKIYMTDSLSLSLSLSHLVTHTHCKHTLPPSPSLSLSLSKYSLTLSIREWFI